MTGLDHTLADLAVRERFAVTEERTQEVLRDIKSGGIASGCVIISTCNRTELYASVPDDMDIVPAKVLCELLGRDYSEYERFFMERVDERAIEHLIRVASGLDSQIIGDDQIITQAREALELSRDQDCTDSYIETMFKQAIQAAKIIKTNIILRTLGIDSVPGSAVEKLKSLMTISGLNAVVIGNGQMGRLVSELLIKENVNVTVTLRQYKKGVIQVPAGANTIAYSERYSAIEQADIVLSATSSPHFTLYLEEMKKLIKVPKIIVDMAVPRDIDPSIEELPGIRILTIDDISGKNRELPPESVTMIEGIISDHIENYHRWRMFKDNSARCPV